MHKNLQSFQTRLSKEASFFEKKHLPKQDISDDFASCLHAAGGHDSLKVPKLALMNIQKNSLKKDLAKKKKIPALVDALVYTQTLMKTKDKLPSAENIKKIYSYSKTTSEDVRQTAKPGIVNHPPLVKKYSLQTPDLLYVQNAENVYQESHKHTQPAYGAVVFNKNVKVVVEAMNLMA